MLFVAVPVSSPEPLTLTADAAPRQTFRGLGAGLFPWTPAKAYNATVTAAETRDMARRIWREAGFRSVRLWIHPGEEPLDYYIDGFVGTGKLPAILAAGATSLLLAPERIPPAMGDGRGLIRDAEIPRYAAILADFIRGFKDRTGILIDRCGVLNEPNDRPVKLSDAQWPVMIRALRTALDARGLKAVGIVAPESANCGPDAYAAVDAIRADPKAWFALAGIATHSYNNAATEEMARRREGKEYWITEASDTGPEAPGDALRAASLASRFLNDMNHGATDWIHFIGFEAADPNDDATRILSYATAPFRLTTYRKFESYRALSRAFPVGAIFRHLTSSLDGEMTYTYGRKPRLNAALAKTPDGGWAISLSNFTSPTFPPVAPGEDDGKHFETHNSGYPAQSFDVTVQAPEIRGTVRFRVARLAAEGAAKTSTLVMRDGTLTIPNVAPLELVTLQSLP